MEGLAAPLDDLARRMSEGVRSRFPAWDRSEALLLLGAERGIRRGPSELSGRFASRLVRWWDDHRGRAGAYALIAQARAFWTGTGVTSVEVVSHRGVRHAASVGSDGVVRDVISWGADGTSVWAQFWLFLYVTVDPRPIDDVTYLAVPVDWTAAHVRREHVVILWGHGRLWDYPIPTGSWTFWEKGLTWDQWDSQSPIIITHEET